jgi:hypothetical protein
MVTMLMEPDTPFNILFPCEHYWGEIFSNPRKFGLVEPPVTIETINSIGRYLFIGKLTDYTLKNLNEAAALARRDGRYFVDHTMSLNLIFEDDTASVVSSINRYRYDTLSEKVTLGKNDWYLVKGTINDKWRRVDIQEILNLSQWGLEHGLGPLAEALQVRR